MPDLQSPEQRFTEVLQATIEQWPIDPDERDEVSRRVTALGGTQAIKLAIRESGDSNGFVSLHDRPDLTLEALALCPAWKSLFSEEEKSTARTRLSEAKKWEDRPERPVKTFKDTWVFWIDGRPVGVSHRNFAPEDSSSPSATCEMFARMAETFAESGQFGASLQQRRHFRTCGACSVLASLDQVVTLADKEDFHRLQVLLSMVPELLHKSAPTLALPPLWVLLGFIDLEFDVKPEDWVAARQGLTDGAFAAFVQSLSPSEFVGFPLAKRMASVFQPAIVADAELWLPEELGLLYRPGILNTFISADEWNRRVEKADEKVWGLKPGAGIFEDDRFDCLEFERVVIEASSLQIVHWWKGPGAEYLLPPDLHPISPEPPEVPRNNQTPIKLAEASLREALGSEIFDNLCLDAFKDATAAERQYHDQDLGQGQGILFHLVNAFHHQLVQVVLKPFADGLKLAGVLDFPWPINKPLTKVGELGLGDIKMFIQYPTPELSAFFETKRLDLSALAAAVREVHKVRNPVSHIHAYTPDEGRKFRDLWFGIERGDGGIFGLLRPRVT